MIKNRQSLMGAQIVIVVVLLGGIAFSPVWGQQSNSIALASYTVPAEVRQKLTDATQLEESRSNEHTFSDQKVLLNKLIFRESTHSVGWNSTDNSQLQFKDSLVSEYNFSDQSILNKLMSRVSSDGVRQKLTDQSPDQIQAGRQLQHTFSDQSKLVSIARADGASEKLTDQSPNQVQTGRQSQFKNSPVSEHNFSDQSILNKLMSRASSDQSPNQKIQSSVASEDKSSDRKTKLNKLVSRASYVGVSQKLTDEIELEDPEKFKKKRNYSSPKKDEGAPPRPKNFKSNERQGSGSKNPEFDRNSQLNRPAESSLLDKIRTPRLGQQPLRSYPMQQAANRHSSLYDPNLTYAASATFAPPSRANGATIAKTWRTPDTAHGPLLFEEAELERYGHNRKFQTLRSGIHFFGSLVALPYQSAIHRNECEFGMGHYRPGDCNPAFEREINRSPSAFARQALIVTALSVGL